MLLFALACEVVSSEELATAEMQPSFHISFFEDMSFLATAVLRKEDAALKIVTVDLAEGDSMSVALGETSFPMVPTEVYSDQTDTQILSVYSASGSYDETMLYTAFSLTRANSDNAPESVVARPSSFVVTGFPESWPKATDLPIAWTPTDILPMGVTTSADCTLENLEAELDEDGGAYTVGAMYLDFNPIEYDACEVSAYVTRKSTGTLDGAFLKGSIDADFMVPAVFSLTAGE